MNLSMNRSITLVLSLFFLILAHFIKYSFGIGSYYYTFSLVAVLAPLMGLYFSFFERIALLGGYSIAMTLITKTLFIPFLATFGLPTLAASACLSFRKEDKDAHSFWIEVGLPMVCMLLFAIHPIGASAIAYSFYWLIPMALYGTKKMGYSSLFSSALSSTFVTHAVGSSIYLYRFGLTSSEWHALIPVVAAERLIIAASMSTIIIALYTIKKMQLFHSLNLANTKQA